MRARKITLTERVEMMPVNCLSTLFHMGKEIDGDRYFAFRKEAPVFVIEGGNPTEVYTLAEQTVSDFLAKMHRFGFRR